MKKTKHKGFTLIELLVVVAIIAILSGTILVALNSARSKAKDARVQSELQELQSQMELYYTTYNSYGSGDCTNLASGVVTSPTSNPFNLQTATYNGAYTLASGIKNDANGIIFCGDTGSSWAAAAPLSSGGDWCVDSNGSSKSETGTLTSGIVACP